MRLPLILLKHVAKAYLNLYGGGVAGEIVVGIAEDVMKSWQLEKDERGRNFELEGIAQATTSEVKEAVAEVVGAVAGDRTDADRDALSAYLMQIPASIRRTLRRATDTSGKTVPSGFPLKTAADLAAILPDRLPRFRPGESPLAGVDRELVELLGIGGFGEVWKAINPNRPSMSPVALKFCIDQVAKDRLLRHEAKLLDRIMQVGVHPGIVTLRDTYFKADPPCLEYEFVGGGELTGMIREFHSRGGISPREAARIVECLASTVGYFHRLDPPIVHRDLKPANILVTYDDQKRIGFKIADFGIGGLAAGREIERSETRRSQQEPSCSILHGSYTPLYASSQQVRGEPPDPRDDVHALGVIWFQLLAGDLSHGAPTGLDWTEDLEERGMTREQIGILASCFSSKLGRRPASGAVLAEKIGAVFRLREGMADANPLGPKSSPHLLEEIAPTNPHTSLKARLGENNEVLPETVTPSPPHVSGNPSRIGTSPLPGFTHQLTLADFGGVWESHNPWLGELPTPVHLKTLDEHAEAITLVRSKGNGQWTCAHAPSIKDLANNRGFHENHLDYERKIIVPVGIQPSSRGSSVILPSPDMPPNIINKPTLSSRAKRVFLCTGTEPNLFRYLVRTNFSGKNSIYMFDMKTKQFFGKWNPVSREWLEYYAAIGTEVDHPKNLSIELAWEWIEYGIREAARRKLDLEA